MSKETHLVLEPSFVLHARPYLNSSRIVTLFTENHGRLPVVARGARRSRCRYQALLQPFQPVLLSAKGRSHLLTLQGVDRLEVAPLIPINHLKYGLYLNELIIKLIPEYDAYPVIYHGYLRVLHHLSQPHWDASYLRVFEKRLIHELGYGVDLMKDATSGQPIEPDGHYVYHMGHGFKRAVVGTCDALLGQHLIDIHHDRYPDRATLLTATRIMATVLLDLTRGQGFKSARWLFHHEYQPQTI